MITYYSSYNSQVGVFLAFVPIICFVLLENIVPKKWHFLRKIFWQYCNNISSNITYDRVISHMAALLINF